MLSNPRKYRGMDEPCHDQRADIVNSTKPLERGVVMRNDCAGHNWRHNSIEDQRQMSELVFSITRFTGRYEGSCKSRISTGGELVARFSFRKRSKSVVRFGSE